MPSFTGLLFTEIATNNQVSRKTIYQWREKGHHEIAAFSCPFKSK